MHEVPLIYAQVNDLKPWMVTIYDVGVGSRVGDYVYEAIDMEPGKVIRLGDGDRMSEGNPGVWRYRPIAKKAGESVDQREMFYWGGYGEPAQPLSIRHPQMGVIEGVERMKMTHGWTKDRACRFAADGWQECVVSRPIREPGKDEEGKTIQGFLPEDLWGDIEGVMPHITYRAIRVLVIEGTKEFVRETMKRSVIDEKAPTAFLEQGGTVSYLSTKFEKVLDVEEAELWSE